MKPARRDDTSIHFGTHIDMRETAGVHADMIRASKEKRHHGSKLAVIFWNVVLQYRARARIDIAIINVVRSTTISSLPREASRIRGLHEFSRVSQRSYILTISGIWRVWTRPATTLLSMKREGTSAIETTLYRTS